jgi:hypothetical protein
MTEETLTTHNRVKVYELDEQSQWIDKGTGHVYITYVEVSKTLLIDNHFIVHT